MAAEIPDGWFEIPFEVLDRMRREETRDALFRNVPYPDPRQIAGIPVHLREGHWYVDGSRIGAWQQEELMMRNFNDWKPELIEQVIDPDTLRELQEAEELAQEDEDRAMLRAQLMMLQKETGDE